MTEAMIWEHIGTLGEDFWTNLPLYPWARELMELCEAYAPTYICTSPSLDPGSLSGKIKACQRVWGRRFRKFVVTPNKYLMSREEHLLVDDSDKNCHEWGLPFSSYLFPQPWNSAMWGDDDLSTDNVLHKAEIAVRNWYGRVQKREMEQKKEGK
jgi:hypothetical protein